MLRIRYNTDPDFGAILHFIGELDEELSEIDKLLSDDKLLELIEADLSQRYPHTTQTGRNSFSQSNETFAKGLGVQHIILPKSGYKSGQRQQHEKQRYFRQGRYWEHVRFARGKQGRDKDRRAC